MSKITSLLKIPYYYIEIRCLTGANALLIFRYLTTEVLKSQVAVFLTLMTYFCLKSLLLFLVMPQRGASQLNLCSQ